MVIKTEKVKSWSAKPLKYKHHVYPQCDDGGDAPRFFWVSVFCGSRASGKTYTMCQLLKHYERCGVKDEKTGKPLGQRIILFTPTFSANPVWTSLAHLDEADVYHEYTEDALRDVVADIQAEHEATEKYKNDMEVYARFLKARTMEELSNDDIIALSMTDFQPPTPPRFPNGCVNYLLLDDLVGSSALKNGRSYLNYITIRNRHMKLNIGILVQSMKAVPKILRNNTNLFAIWRYANKKMVVEDLYEEVSGALSQERFEEIYDYATEKDHGCLVIDFTQGKEKRFKRGFEEVIKLD